VGRHAAAGRLPGAPSRPPWGTAWQTSSQAYLYDVYGNLVETTTDGVPLELPADSSTNRLDATGVCYDARGNLVRYSPGQACGFVQTVGDRYDFDALDRMAARRRLGEEESYRFLYTADDERVATFVDRAAGDELFWTLRDLGGRELREFYGAGTAKRPFRDHVYRGELLLGLYEVEDQVEVHLALDHLGSPRKETLWDRTEATVTPATERKYYPFGAEALAVSQYGHTRRFTGHERDLFNPAGTDDDLDYLHARFRSPLTGRFLSVDPILSLKRAMKRPQAWNRYSYVVGNPLKYIDPSGAVFKLAGCGEGGNADQCNAQKALLANTLGANANQIRVNTDGTVSLAKGVSGSKFAAGGDFQKGLLKLIGASGTFSLVTDSGKGTATGGGTFEADEQGGGSIYLETSMLNGRTGDVMGTPQTALVHETAHALKELFPAFYNATNARFLGSTLNYLNLARAGEGYAVNFENRYRRARGLDIRNAYNAISPGIIVDFGIDLFPSE